MGLFNVIKLANDYNKAKKLLQKNNAKVKDIENSIVKVQEFIIELKAFIKDLNAWIDRAKDLISDLSTKIPRQKGK